MAVGVQLVIDCAEEFTGPVIASVGERKGELKHLGKHGDRTRLEFTIPSRGLLGFRLEFLTLTKGTGLINHLFDQYGPHRGPLPNRIKGTMIAKEGGEVTGYAVDRLPTAASSSSSRSTRSTGARSSANRSRNPTWSCSPARRST